MVTFQKGSQSSSREASSWPLRSYSHVKCLVSVRLRSTDHTEGQWNVVTFTSSLNVTDKVRELCWMHNIDYTPLEAILAFILKSLLDSPWTLIHWSNQNTVFNLNAVHSALSIISVQTMTLSSEGDQLRYAYYIMPLCYYFMFRKKTCLQICRCRIEQWIKNKSSDKYLLVSEAFGCSASHVEAFMNTLSLSSTGG